MKSSTHTLRSFTRVATITLGAVSYVLLPMQAVADASPAVARPSAPDAGGDHAGHDHAALPAATAPQAAGAANEVTLYTCPMHPQIVEDHPGQCPICGMDLVPKLFPSGTRLTAGADAGRVVTAAGSPPPVVAPTAPVLPSVAVAPQTLKWMNVVLAKASWRRLDQTIRTVGLVSLDENRVVHVHPRGSGWVESLAVRAVGDPVKRGQVLLSYYSPELVAAQKDFVVAQNSGMTALKESSRERLRLLDFSDAQIERLAKTGQVQRTVPIVAPQDGYISALTLRDGMYIQPSMDLFTIADDRRIWVQVQVLVQDMSRVAVGQSAEMTIDGLPGKTWRGRVDFIYPALDPVTRTLQVRLVFDNPEGLLKPNQFANITLNQPTAGEVLTVPTTAIIPAPDGARVVRRNPDGSLQPVWVKTGVSAGGYTEILSGLKPDEAVVASGQFLIDSESNLLASFDRMTGTAHPSGEHAQHGQ
ncbi:efflux RND transporter periplasmic adaptor subunit [Halothiobacillus sp. DCM-1]|uniref:efflux RND transporter periplasmic adaptor subunit n=1 Tax=Halothiobacillus sp. DCM-1 TaxID=3112558 RepID=UPI003246C452